MELTWIGAVEPENLHANRGQESLRGLKVLNCSLESKIKSVEGGEGGWGGSSKRDVMERNLGLSERSPSQRKKKGLNRDWVRH